MTNVPSYLQQSVLFMALEAGDADAFQVPKNVLKPNLDLHSFLDLMLLLHTVRFWGTPTIPFEVTRFLLSAWCYNELEEKELKEDFPEYWHGIGNLISVRKVRSSDKIVVAITLQLDLEIISYLLSHEQVLLDASMCPGAARYNRLDCLQYLHEYGCPWDAGTTSTALTHGNIDCYKYAESHGCEVGAMVIVRPAAFV